MSSIVLTDKFAKEVEKFFVWASVGYSVQDINGDAKVWSLSLLKSFDEPARNKLETFIKELMKKYTISMGDEIVEDFKLFAKAYKEAPKVKKETKTKLTKQDKKEPKKIVQKGNVDEEKKTEPKKTDIVVDANLDTSDTWHLETLEFDTRQLIKAFGTPLKNGGKNGGKEGDEHKYEWKLKVLGTEGVYTIYDFINEDGSYDDFDEAEWYLGGDNENTENIQKIIKYIINCEGKKPEVVKKEVKEPVTVKKEVKEPESVKKVKETETLKDLFGDEDDNAFSFNKEKDDNLVFDQDSDEDIVLDLNDLDNLDEDFEF
jgi:hypothetical protein